MEQHGMDVSQPMVNMPNDPPLGTATPQQAFPKKAARNKKNVKTECSSMSIEVDLRTELTTNNVKTPISILQEQLSRRGVTPQYDLIQVEGAVHKPTFRYRVSYQDKDAMGTGKSKKEAKHAAAKALIDKIAGTTLIEHPVVYVNATEPEPLNQQNGKKKGKDEPTDNPIGWVQEMCMARRWPPPMYAMETEVGLPHERQFTIACTVLKYREVGEGKSKKIAKRQAAQKMWQRLQDQPLQPKLIMQLMDEDGSDELRQTGYTGRYAGLKDACIPTLSSIQSQKVSQFHKALKSRSGEALNQLQVISLSDRSIDFIRLLSEIAKEQRFEVTYVDIDEKTTHGKQQCLVQLSTMPVAVCHGTGKTIQDAQLCAAKNSLEYLKIMTKS